MHHAAKFTVEQREKALRLYGQHGACEAARLTGIPRPTISRWARETGASERIDPNSVRAERVARTRAATEAAKLSAEQKRAELAARLLDEARLALDEMHSPTVIHHWGTDQAPKGMTGGTVFMEHTIERPTFADRFTISKTVATLLRDHMLLSGEATDRTETLPALERVRELRAKLRVVPGRAKDDEEPKAPAG